jgi:hypothetical protein
LAFLGTRWGARRAMTARDQKYAETLVGPVEKRLSSFDLPMKWHCTDVPTSRQICHTREAEAATRFT